MSKLNVKRTLIYRLIIFRTRKKN